MLVHVGDNKPSLLFCGLLLFGGIRGGSMALYSRDDVDEEIETVSVT